MKKITSNITNNNETIAVIDGKTYLCTINDNKLNVVTSMNIVDVLATSFILTVFIKRHCLDIYHTRGNKTYKCRYYTHKQIITEFKLVDSIPIIPNRVTSVSNTIDVIRNHISRKLWYRGFFNRVIKRNHGEELKIVI